MLTIRPVTEEDHTDISVLLVSAFRQPNESTLIRELRKGGHVALELLAETEEGPVGHICLSRLVAPRAWWTLAPVSVRPENTRQGIGGELIRHGLDGARRGRAEAVVVVGDPDYYHRFGFVFDGPAALRSPYPAQYTGLYPIAPKSAMAQAALRYPPPFDVV